MNKNERAVFDPEKILAVMESLKQPSGGFIAATTDDYRAVWLRDHLYTVFSYYYLKDYEKLKSGVRVAFNILHHERQRLEQIQHNHSGINDFLPARCDPYTLQRETSKEWPHHQLDALGLFLHIVADLDFKNIRVMRDRGDEEILQLLVFYLLNVRYWYNADFGMWEACKARHSSSIGAAVAGLQYVKRRGLAVVPDELISRGKNDLLRILPAETDPAMHETAEECRKDHDHSCDMAQLSLIWPYNVVDSKMADEIIRNIEKNLVGMHGVIRFKGDTYYLSENKIQQGWPMGFFWLAIIYSQRHEYKKAKEWFERGVQQITPEGSLPEIYQNGKPNDHTPLAWAHAMALIAWCKLPEEIKSEFTKG